MNFSLQEPSKGKKELNVYYLHVDQIFNHFDTSSGYVIFFYVAGKVSGFSTLKLNIVDLAILTS